MRADWFREKTMQYGTCSQVTNRGLVVNPAAENRGHGEEIVNETAVLFSDPCLVQLWTIVIYFIQQGLNKSQDHSLSYKLINTSNKDQSVTLQLVS